MTHKNLDSGIYMVAETGRSDQRVKIGMSKNIRNRVYALQQQCSSPLELVWSTPVREPRKVVPDVLGRHLLDKYWPERERMLA